MRNDNTLSPDEQRLVDGVALLKATEGSILPDPVPGELTVAHADYLAAQAVNPELARSLGVRSLSSPADTADLDGVWTNWANFPAILFPWVSPDGRTEYQVRPDDPTTDQRGRLRKYVFRRDMVPVLWAVRPVPDADCIVIIEGTKQCLAGASYAPDGVAVYGISGCRSWQTEGTPIPDLAVADGKTVVVILDADAASNLDVYGAGIGLAEALAMEGATKVLFGRLPAAGKSGLDDVLATRAPDRRTAYLDRIIKGAKSKPADAKPKPRKKGSVSPKDANRVTIVCNRDRLDVINELTDALLTKWDGTNLFNHGGVISRLKKRTMCPIDRGAQRDLIQETAMTVDEHEDATTGTSYTFTWPDANTISATMSRADKFAPLERVSNAPFARPDGTIVTTPGYDEATRTMLIPDPELEGMEVPETPTPDQVAAARELIMEEWLGDFPFDGEADRANVLGLIVTPAIRGLVPRVPLAVVDGLQMGVGKNLLADSILTVYTGEPARPMNFVDEKEELRKQITSAFRTGQEFFVFDEAHTLAGAALAQALTASTWQDRILGVSTMAEFPNRVTWISLGNQVQVQGDLTRRVYRIGLRPGYANPQDRKADSFRHPGQSGLDLGSWTRKNRKALMGAILTLVRAWFAQGSPYPARGVSFGSFEAWERTVGGIVETAGLPGFLGNLKVWRSESDFDSQYWINHLKWLADNFGTRPFRTRDVQSKALADPAGYMAPPKLDDTSDKAYGKSLGEMYSRKRGRTYDGMRLARIGNVSGHVSEWIVEIGEAMPSAPKPRPEPPAPKPVVEPEPTVEPAPYNEHAEARGADESDLTGGETDAYPEPAPGPADLVTVDLETYDAKDLYRYGPEYTRLAGWAVGDGDVKVTSSEPTKAVQRVVSEAGVLTGHNIMSFDLPVLVRAGVLTMPEVHRMAADGRLFDGLICAQYLDPPMAREKGIDAERRYNLDVVGEKYGLGNKDNRVDALKKKYKGWGNIPVEDSDPDGRIFREYLTQDVTLSRALYHRLMDEFGGTVPEYLAREHRVAAIATQMSINGFRVDPEELARRVAHVKQGKKEALHLLCAKYDIPLADARGKPYAAPLATKIGKNALTHAFYRAGATSLWRTEKAMEIMVGADHMRHLASEYAHLPEVVEIAKLVYKVVGSRTVYETIEGSMVGDRVHPKVAFKQATGRWSLTAPGLTVMGKRGGRHVERAVLLPDPGQVLVSFDLSQVDMRALAALSQDQAYIEMLKHDDPHAQIAIELFGTAARREEAKAIGHGWNYGRGIKAISESNDLDPAIVKQFDQSMYARFPRLVQWQGEVRAIAEAGELMDNGFGRMMRPDPQRSHTQGPALMGQGAARDIMMTGMLRLPAEVLPMLRAQIHDEIVLSIPVDIVDDVSRAVVDALSFEWRGVPILADRSPAGTDWSLCYVKG